MKRLILVLVATGLLINVGISKTNNEDRRKHYIGNKYRPPVTTPVPPPVPPTTPVPNPVPNPTPPPVVVPPTQGNSIVLQNVYTTGYSSYDNTPRGSLRIDLGGISGSAGGDGTYSNPTTLAVGHSIINGVDIPDFSYGTMFYVPNVRKYFKAADTCGDGATPQNNPCHNLKTADKGATLWLDLYVGPSASSSVTACESTITGLHTVIQNPANNLPVVQGDIYPQCIQYGDSIN